MENVADIRSMQASDETHFLIVILNSRNYFVELLTWEVDEYFDII